MSNGTRKFRPGRPDPGWDTSIVPPGGLSASAIIAEFEGFEGHDHDEATTN